MQAPCRALTLTDLPKPLSDKVGWPWTEASDLLPECRPDGSEWPRMSIVTPSYNQGQFIEETIRSVLLQGYPNLEYIVIDGGSTDSSVEIIRKYEPWITYWVSEPDRGQTDAIQKGFDRATGILWNWLNSDDLLEINALQVIASTYSSFPEASVFSGLLTIFFEDPDEDMYLHKSRFKSLQELACVWETWPDPQPSIFLSRQACIHCGQLNPNLHYSMDYDLYLRLASKKGFQANLIDVPVARARRHAGAKTVSQSIAMKTEILQVFDTFSCQNPSLLPKYWKLSRVRAEYHLCLDRFGDEKQFSFVEFLRISFPFLPSIWFYRFFWATSFVLLKQKVI